MQCGIVLLLLSFGYISAEKKVIHLDPEKMVQHLPVIVQCAEETKISPQIINQFSGKTWRVDENFNKFRYCLFTKTGYADKNGHVKIDKALDFFPKDVDRDSLKKAMVECNKEEGTDPPDTVYKFAKCFIEKSDFTIKL